MAQQQSTASDRRTAAAHTRSPRCCANTAATAYPWCTLTNTPAVVGDQQQHSCCPRRMGNSRPHLLVLAPLVALVLMLHAPCARAQQNMPFAGNGQEPEEPTTVFVSSYVDRLSHINDKEYEFEALVFVYLSWTDPRARQTVEDNRLKLAANSSESCKLQCQLYPENQPKPVKGCCDDVWLPYVSFSNLKLLSQDRVMRWGVNIDPSSDGVGYWSIILGTFMASMDLRAFPFDMQRLNIQMEIPGWAGGNVRLKPSSGGTRMFNANPDGDALSGWSVHAVRLSTYNLSLCQRYTVSSSQASASDDPVPLVSELLFTDPRIKASSKACTAVLAENQLDPSYSVYSRHNLDGSATEVQQGQALNVSGVTCTIVIKRYAAQYVMSAIMPIVASVWLGFVVFLLPRDCMNSRLGAVMTIFVALAAIQFVVSQDLPNSSYMTALQQLIAAGYVCLILIAAEAVGIWLLTTYHSTGKRLAMHQAARQQFETGVKAELEVLRQKLAEMLAEQQEGVSASGSSLKRGSLKSFGYSMRGITMRRISKTSKSASAAVGGVGGQPSGGVQFGAGSVTASRSCSGASSDARASVAALAVASADVSNINKDITQQQPPYATPSGDGSYRSTPGAAAHHNNSQPLAHAKSDGALLRMSSPDVGNSSDVLPKPSAASPDQTTAAAAQAVLQEMQRLEQQLANAQRQQQLVDAQRAAAATGFGLLPPVASPEPPELGGRAGSALMTIPSVEQQISPFVGAAAGGKLQGVGPGTAGAAQGPASVGRDAVLLTVGSAAEPAAGGRAEYGAATPSCWCPSWRLWARLRLYISALERDATLTDHLSYQLNKWLAISQFIAYNVAVVLIFVINRALYLKS